MKCSNKSSYSHFLIQLWATYMVSDILRQCLLAAAARRKSDSRDLPFARYGVDSGAVSIDTQTSPSLGFIGGASAFETFSRSVPSDESVSEASIATESAYSAHEDSVTTPTTPVSASTSNNTDVSHTE